MDNEKPMRLDIRVFRVSDEDKIAPAMGIEEERGHLLWSMAYEAMRTMQDVLEATQYVSTLCANPQELAFVCLVIGRWWRENELLTLIAQQRRAFDDVIKRTH